MKFRKIEIQAFRAYKDKEHSTFDFNYCQNKVANLVSIYAPNGFGKTSFYDAIEWCITNRIKRIDDADNLHQHIKVERTRNKNTSQESYAQDVIRNKYAPNSLEGFVKAYPVLDNIPEFSNKIGKKRSGSADYPKGELINKEYRDVLLSQDGIDAFLKSETAEERYEKFITHFDDNKLDSIYKNISELLKENDVEINEINGSIVETDLILSKEVDLEIVKKFNDVISELNAKGFSIAILPNQVNAQQLLLIGKEVESIRLNYLTGVSNKLKSSEDKKDKIKRMIFEIPEFNKNSDYILILENEKKEKEDIVSKFYELDKLGNKDRFEKGAHSSLVNEIEKLNFLVENLDFINFNNTSINSIDIEKQSCLNRLQRLNNLNLNIESSIKIFGNRLSSNLIKSNEITSKKIEIENNYISFKKSKSDSRSVLTALKALNTNQGKINKLIDLSKNRIKELASNINNIKNFSTDVKTNNENLNKLIKNIRVLKIDVFNLTDENNSIKKEVSNSSTYLESVSNLVETGKKLIEENKLQSCPLCQSDFNTFSDLLESINKNRVLDENILALNKKLADKEAELKKIQSKLESCRIEALTFLENLINEEQIVLDNLNFELLEIKNDILKAEKESITYVGVSQKFQNEFEGKELSEVVDEYLINYKILENQSIIFQQNIDKYKKLLSRTSELETVIHLDIDLLQNKKDKLLNNPILIKINNIINDLGIKILSKSELESIIKNKYFESKLLALNLKENRKQIVEVSEVLKEFNLANLEEDLIRLSEEIKIKVHEVNLFHSSLKEINETLNLSNIESELKSELNKIEKELVVYNEILDLIRQIDFFSNSIKDFISYSENANKKEILQQKLSERKNLEKELISNRNIISNTIKEMIANFFYDKLINELLNQIDPHPDYKNVKFEVDFESGKPSLNVFVSKNNIELEEISPNLYFSTAQLNILSLSIFLAKALNAKDANGKPIDCIFIDDPIQSMDSINILSIIDLLRSLIINYDKQIILSTHDENFHRLLQKKLPSDIFCSKFIELETYGKVKQP
ncbi:AAA family ATPase [Adhaeribacter rhizoryzae]|uniref:Rad50/SbcC-type AAA domain-containing protein n=1 Tax=Adhaeribacter rhizoryzae TaxID=2607907 RepID=A0A5M6D3L1_9BACT|nr:AAA family ATPase [Adhaeribacter rhizoryzae]KAA5542064.1 hypothetical protein F0145_19960 [Adhaeribacter rhizoryzae]